MSGHHSLCTAPASGTRCNSNAFASSNDMITFSRRYIIGRVLGLAYCTDSLQNTSLHCGTLSPSTGRGYSQGAFKSWNRQVGRRWRLVMAGCSTQILSRRPKGVWPYRAVELQSLGQPRPCP